MGHVPPLPSPHIQQAMIDLDELRKKMEIDLTTAQPVNLVEITWDGRLVRIIVRGLANIIAPYIDILREIYGIENVTISYSLSQSVVLTPEEAEVGHQIWAQAQNILAERVVEAQEQTNQEQKKERKDTGEIIKRESERLWREVEDKWSKNWLETRRRRQQEIEEEGYRKNDERVKLIPFGKPCPNCGFPMSLRISSYLAICNGCGHHHYL